MELDILHRAVAPEIVEFYGAFFVESCVYYCMEYMDAGSLEQLQRAGVPEDVLARITQSMVKGLKFLKDELQIMHRGEFSFHFFLFLVVGPFLAPRAQCRCHRPASRWRR